MSTTQNLPRVVERLSKRAALVDRDATERISVGVYYGEIGPRTAIRRLRAIITGGSAASESDQT